MKTFRGAKPRPSPFGAGTRAAPDTPNTDRLPPVFSFEHMQRGSGYSVECCDVDHRAALAARLFLLSRMTWLEIRNAPRHGLGAEKIPRSAIRASIPATVSEDADLIAIRYNGLHPMVGYRDARIFHVLFVDHTMTVYAH